MEHKSKKAITEFKSESSIINHPYSYPKKDQLVFPTWLLLLILVGAFFVLKSFIYIPDNERHGK